MLTYLVSSAAIACTLPVAASCCVKQEHSNSHVYRAITASCCVKQEHSNSHVYRAITSQLGVL
jgi:hypothetical protein